MISSPLFRPGDTVHYCQNLQPCCTYRMLHKPSTDCEINPTSGMWCINHKGVATVIDELTVAGKYMTGGLIGICDEMFAEAVRIAPYLVNVDVPPSLSIFNFASYNPDEWTDVTDWTGFTW